MIVKLSSHVVITCPNVTLPVNGHINYNPSATPRFEGTVVSYICNAGYTLVGSMTQTCQSNREWSFAAPFCDGEIHSMHMLGAALE